MQLFSYFGLDFSSLGKERLQLLYQKTGAPIHAAYALAQLRVWYKNTPLARKVNKWQTIASACLCRWTGRTSLPISYSEASWTGLLNFCSCRYEPAALELLPPECRKALPALADYTGENTDGALPPMQQLANVFPPMYVSSLDCTSNDNGYYDRWPALRDARLFLGIGDGACANLGSKCSTPATIACTVGTSAAARVCLPLALRNSDNDGAADFCAVEPGLFCYRIDQSHVLVGGALTDGGSVVEWISKLLNLPVSSDAFQECLLQAELLLDENYVTTTATRELTMVPFLSGERSTGFRSGATGVMLGLTLQTTPVHLLKACLEGVTLRINAIVQLIQKVAATTQSDSYGEQGIRIICSGKALEENALWRRMLADCTGLEVVMDEQTQEGTSRGVAVLVARALQGDCHKDRSTEYVNEPIDDSKTSFPHENARGYWENASHAQESLIDAVSPLHQ
jgi:gluconokinase